MLTNTTLSFIGSGAMAEAMIKGILSQKLIEAGSVTASGPRPEHARGTARAVRHSCPDRQQACRPCRQDRGA